MNTDEAMNERVARPQRRRGMFLANPIFSHLESFFWVFCLGRDFCPDWRPARPRKCRFFVVLHALVIGKNGPKSKARRVKNGVIFPPWFLFFGIIFFLGSIRAF